MTSATTRAIKLPPGSSGISKPLEHALALPNGARFFRCALQVNPAHYTQTFRGQKNALDEAAYIEALIQHATRNGIEVLGITDHNDCQAAERIATRAAAEGIVVFPGFEVTSSEGVHVLCLFEPGTDRELVGRHLGELGIKTLGPSTDLCKLGFGRVLEMVSGAGGVCIAAHATATNGLLHELDGKARAEAWRHSALLAVQIPGTVDALPPSFKQIVRNTDPAHQRSLPRGDKLAIAVINAKDIAQPEDLDEPAASTRIKMTTPTVEGLRQAFLDPDSRVRLVGDTQPPVRADLLAVTWESGFLDGAAVHFNENLNVLVGGRGAGKSSVIESIRWALGQPPIGSAARAQHEAIVKHVVPGGTKVSLLVRTREPDERLYVIERSSPNPPVVKEANGQLSSLSPQQVLRADIFGQHELSELAASEEHPTRLLERFVVRDAQLAGRKADMRRKLEASRRRLLTITKELSDIRDRLAEMPQLEETLKRYQDAGVEARLKDQSLLVREERILATADERLDRFAEVLDGLRRELPPDTAFLSDAALAELPGKPILVEARKALDAAADGAAAAEKALKEGLANARAALAGTRQRWGQRKDDAKKTYEKALRELQQSRIDGVQYVELKRALENLRPLMERKGQLERDQALLVQERVGLSVEWEEMKRAEFAALEKAAKSVTKRLERAVAVNPTYGGGRRPLFDLLSKRVSKFSDAAKSALDTDKLSLTELAAACRTGAVELETKFSLSAVMAKRMADLGEELAMEIEEVELTTTTEISLNVAGKDQPVDLRPLGQLSAGQRATALLLIVLLESEGPLIVDQPEDDLDNRFITEGVVPRMKGLKERRQFIFATHNANIPVLADAELIVGMQAEAVHARIDHALMGSIDTDSVRQFLEAQLEGGRQAFELRRLKYGY